MKRQFLMMCMIMCLIMAQAAFADPPVNDNCVDATDAGTLVPGVTVPLTGTTSQATMECNTLGSPEVWVKFTISNYMNVTIDFCSQGGTVRSMPSTLFNACPCGGAINSSGTGSCINRNPALIWNALAPGTYYYGITTGTVIGAYTINITGANIPVPANDNCSSATAIGEVSTLAFTTLGAAFDGEGTCNSAPNVWYVYTPTFTGTARIIFSGTNYSTKFAVYNGASCSPLSTQIGCTDLAYLDFAVTTDLQYLIEIGGNNGATGSGNIKIGTAPPNDNCANATDAGTLAPGVTVPLTGTASMATMDCSTLGSPEVWVKFTISNYMNVTIDFCSQSGSVTTVPSTIFNECPCGGAISYSVMGSCGNHNPSRTWNALAPGTYYYGITTTTVSGAYTINITGANVPAPANDNCASAIAVGEVTNLAFTTIGAAFDGEGTCNSAPNVWYVYTPTFSGTARISLAGSGYSTRFAVYNGATCSPLSAQIACTDQTSLDFAVVSGSQYLVEIGGNDGAFGNGSLTISTIGVVPPNDNCVDATDAGTLVSGVTVPLTGTTSQATVDCSTLGSPEVWVKFTTSSYMNVTIDFCNQSGSIHSMPNMLFSECPCGGAINNNGMGNCGNHNPSLNWNTLAPGTYYYGITSATVSGAYTVNITGVVVPPPANDNCDNAMAIGEVTNLAFTTRTATYDGEGSCNSAPNVWYVYSPTFNGTARISLAGSGYSTKFAVYNGATCSPLSPQIGCTDQTSFDFAVTTGSQYLMEIGGNDGASGIGSLTISAAIVIPPNDNCANADDAGTLTSGMPVQLTGTSEGSSRDCTRNPYSEVWVKFTLSACMNVTINYCDDSNFSGQASTQLYPDCTCHATISSNRTTSCPGGNPSLTWFNLTSGIYYFPILANNNVGGPYTINITGVDCPPAPEPDFTINAPYSGTNTTCGAGDDCYLTNMGEDHIYEVTIPTAGNWEFSLCNSTSSFESVLSLGTSVCATDLGTNTSGCNNGHADLKVYNLAAGTYYLTVDSRTQNCGEYTLDIAILPTPCDGSYYSNGAIDNINGVNDYRCDEADSYAADDFTISENVTLDSVKFSFAEIDQIFYFNNTGDLQILSNDQGAPGAVLFERTGVPCTRIVSDQSYHGLNTYTYQLGNLGIELPAGTYFLACRPVVTGICMGEAYWLTTDSRHGAVAYQKSSANPTWTISFVNSDLAFCLFATPQQQPRYEYISGDVNNSGAFNGLDVVYGVGYFKGGNPPPYSAECNGSTWYLAGDVNGSCGFNGLDITFMVSYFKGGSAVISCPDCPPSTVLKR